VPKRSQFLEAWTPLKSQFLSHPESMLAAASFFRTAAPPKCVFYFWQEVLATETKKYLVLILPIFKMFVFHFSICCDYNLFFPECRPFHFKNVFHGL